MPLPVFFPVVRYQRHLPNEGSKTLAEWCQQAGISCRASGPWTERRVLVTGFGQPSLLAEPGYRGTVHMIVPEDLSEEAQAQWVLGAMAYSSLFDGVARESIRHASWNVLEP